MQKLLDIPPARLVTALVLVALLLGYLQSIAQPPAPPQLISGPIDPQKLGMVIRDPWYDFGTSPGHPDRPNYATQDRMGELLAQMGVRWVRLEFHIAGSNAYSLTHVTLNDYFINEVAPRHNFKILGVLNYQLNRGHNPHELASPVTTIDPLYGSGTNTYMRLWLDRARLIANHYGANIAAYEVLNEPNRLGDASYDAIPAMIVARLQAKFYHHFRHVDRAAPGDQAWRDQVQIIVGGLQPAGRGFAGKHDYLSDLDYVRQLYHSHEFQNYYKTHSRFPLDGLGYHPYPNEIRKNLTQADQPTPAPQPSNRRSHAIPPGVYQDVELMNRQLDRVRDVLHEVGDPDVPFWITEIGYNAGYAHHDAETQAEFMQVVYRWLAARDDVAIIFWFKYEDFPPATGPHAQQWGGVVIPFTEDSSCPGNACYDVEGRPTMLRPAFWSYRELAGLEGSEPEPPAQAMISGPMTGTLHTNYFFTVSISRTTATQPVFYTWQVSMHPRVVRETGLSDTMNFAWNIPGTHTIHIEASNAAGTVINSHTINIVPPTPTITPTPLPTPTPTITPTATLDAAVQKP